MDQFRADDAPLDEHPSESNRVGKRCGCLCLWLATVSCHLQHRQLPYLAGPREFFPSSGASDHRPREYQHHQLPSPDGDWNIGKGGTQVFPVTVDRLKISADHVALIGRVLDVEVSPISGAWVERSPNRYTADDWLEP